MTEWFEQWFGEEYLRLYPHRDEHDAGQAVALVDRTVGLVGRRVLDLACGPGRHATHLAARAAYTVGFDLSLPLLTRARHRAGPDVRFVRGDMRQLPFGPDSFDVVVNLFTSFGYFADDAQHAAVIRSVTGLLAAGGAFVLDYFNAPWVRRTLVPREEREAGAQRVIVERRISTDARYVTKEMHLPDDGRSFLERVRLFTPDDLARLFGVAGLRISHRFGDYDGAPLTPASPRAILVGRR